LEIPFLSLDVDPREMMDLPIVQTVDIPLLEEKYRVSDILEEINNLIEKHIASPYYNTKTKIN